MKKGDSELVESLKESLWTFASLRYEQCNDLLARTTEARATKAKVVELHETKKLLHAKKTISGVKSQPMKWGNIFASHLSARV